MTDRPKKPQRLSTATKQPLRSRGMLSHGGGPGPDDEDKPKRSHGMLSHERVNDTSPSTLDAPKPRRPYRLEEK